MEFLRDSLSQFFFTTLLTILGLLLSLPGGIASVRSLTRPKDDEQAKETTSLPVRRPFVADSSLPHKIHTLRTKASATGTYVAALMATASLVPMTAALISLMFYVWPLDVPRQGLIAALCGTLFTLIVWLSSAMPYRRLTSVDRVSHSTFELFLEDFYYAQARLSMVSPKKLFKDPLSPFTLQLLSMEHPVKRPSSAKPFAVPNKELKFADGRVREARDSLDIMYQKLLKKSRSWILGTGYVSVWRMWHSADEALIDIETDEQVVAGALYDKLRIQGSEIAHSEDLVNTLEAAVRALMESKTQHSQNQATQGSQSSMSTASPRMAETQARASVREIRGILHHYSDNLWETIVRARNNLLITGIVSGFLLYVLLELALLSEIQPLVLIGAATFYVVGALVGLFSSLYSSSREDISPVADFSLTVPRLLVTPLLSGFAAVASGLLLQSLHLATMNVSSLKPWTLLIAAISGLIPYFIQNALQKRVGQYEAYLRSIEAQ